MDVAAFKAQVAPEEGLRLTPYTDTKGLLTIGYGHNLANPISRAAADQIFADDVVTLTSELTASLPWWPALPDPQQRALADLALMGVGTLLTFTTFLPLVNAGRYRDAAADLATTQWARDVGPTRLARVCQLLQQVS
jgi:GH24 family phage-related lysozyme (muramidase)